MISLPGKKRDMQAEPTAGKEHAPTSLFQRFRRLFRRKSVATMKTCRKCSTDNPHDVLFCKECGSRYPCDTEHATDPIMTHPGKRSDEKGSIMQQKKAWLEKGNACFKSGQYQEAIEMYDRAIRIDSEYAKAWNNRSLALKKMGRENEALESRNRFLALQNSS